MEYGSVYRNTDIFRRILAVILVSIIAIMSMGIQPANAASSLADKTYEGKTVVKVNKNKPKFTTKQKKLKKSKVKYSKLDKYGRCGKVTAVLTRNKMATGTRGSIGMYRPSGWPSSIGNAKYDFIDGKYLFNRSHLLGWQLWGNKTNNEKNLITGTRQMNAGDPSMLTYENKVASYLKSHKKNHVVYRVTPWFKGEELIARGVQMEAWSVEDKGKLHFNVYVFNVQDGVEFSYYNGESHAVDIVVPDEPAIPTDTPQTGDIIYYLNVSTGKFHLETCRYADSQNIEQTNLTAEQLIADGYSPCQVCHPEQAHIAEAGWTETEVIIADDEAGQSAADRADAA